VDNGAMSEVQTLNRCDPFKLYQYVVQLVEISVDGVGRLSEQQRPTQFVLKRCSIDGTDVA